MFTAIRESLRIVMLVTSFSHPYMLTDATWTSLPKLEKHSLEQGHKHRSIWWQNMNFLIAALTGTSKCAGIQEKPALFHPVSQAQQIWKTKPSAHWSFIMLWTVSKSLEEQQRASLLKIDFFLFFLPTIYYILP